MSATSLARAIAATGRSPCMTCRHAERCAAENLACRDYRYYVNYGEVPDRPDTERVPTRDVYDSIYSTAEDPSNEAPN